jgi:hypothetical protein
MANIMIVDLLGTGAVTGAGTVQSPDQLLFLGVHAEDGLAVGLEGAAQMDNAAELLLPLLGVHPPGDQLPAQGPPPEAQRSHQLCGRIAADLPSPSGQCLGHTARRQMGPADLRIRRAAGRMCFQKAVDYPRQS